MEGSKFRLVLLGKTGCGKSTLANTLLGEDVFKTNDSANSGTEKCEAATRRVGRRSLSLIDTPGFFDTKTSDDQHKNEVLKCIVKSAPGPHAFLILLKVEKFTSQENQVFEKIKETFYEKAFKYAIVVFTHGDQLREGMKIEEFVQENPDLHDLVRRCGDRCHVFDNKYWKQQDGYRSNQFQKGELLTTIEKMVEDHQGGCYTNQMLQQVQRMMQTRERHIQETLEGLQMSSEEIREEAKKGVYQALKTCAGVTTGMLLGALFGVPIMVGKVFSLFKNISEKFEGEAGETAVGIGVGVVGVAAAAGGAVVGAAIGYREAQEETTIMEAVRSTAREVWEETWRGFEEN